MFKTDLNFSAHLFFLYSLKKFFHKHHQYLVTFIYKLIGDINMTSSHTLKGGVSSEG